MPCGPTPSLPRARSLSNDTESRRRLISRGEGGLFPFAPPPPGTPPPLPSRRRERSGLGVRRALFHAAPRRNERNDFSRRVFYTGPATTHARSSRLSSFSEDSEVQRAARRAPKFLSASNKNLGQIGRIVQFYLPRCPPRERVKTFTFSSLKGASYRSYRTFA